MQWGARQRGRRRRAPETWRPGPDRPAIHGKTCKGAEGMELVRWKTKKDQQDRPRMTGAIQEQHQPQAGGATQQTKGIREARITGQLSFIRCSVHGIVGKR